MLIEIHPSKIILDVIKYRGEALLAENCKKQSIKKLYGREITRSKSTSTSELSSIITRQESDKNVPDKQTSQ